MFQFPAFASAFADAGIASGGLPHSEICGSQGICPSPQLIAACHVLLRLREPRHPPCALIRSVISSRISIKMLITLCTNDKFDNVRLWFARCETLVFLLVLAVG